MHKICIDKRLKNKMWIEVNNFSLKGSQFTHCRTIYWTSYNFYLSMPCIGWSSQSFSIIQPEVQSKVLFTN